MWICTFRTISNLPHVLFRFTWADLNYGQNAKDSAFIVHLRISHTVWLYGTVCQIQLIPSVIPKLNCPYCLIRNHRIYSLMKFRAITCIHLEFHLHNSAGDVIAFYGNTFPSTFSCIELEKWYMQFSIQLLFAWQ